MKHLRTVVLGDNKSPAKSRDVEKERSRGPQRRLRDIQQTCVGENIESYTTEKPPALGVKGEGRIAAGVVGVKRAGATLDRMTVWVGRGRQFC